MALTTDQKYELITRNLQEKIVDEDVMKKILEKRPYRIYWGTAPTSMPHLGYFAPMFKIIDFLQAGCEVTILIADLHAVLDNMKSNFNQIEARSKVYTLVIQTLLTSLGCDITKLKFIKGTDFQLNEDYTLDMYKAHTLISVHDAKHAGAEVVKQSDNPKMAGLMYPTLQALDEQYLGVDCSLGGIDQKKIMMHARTLLPKLGYKKKDELMNSMVPGLRFEKKTDYDTDKMSSSDIDKKISLIDTKNIIKTKVNKCYCLQGDVEDNCLLSVTESIIFPCLKLKGLNFTINRRPEYGGPMTYIEFEDLKNEFAKSEIHPGDLKIGVADNLDLIIDPIRSAFKDKEMVSLINRAYPIKN